MARNRGRPTSQQSLAVAKEPLIDTLVGTCASARTALDQSAAERDHQVEDAFFRAAAALEAFLSEWVVRCLSFNANAFRQIYQRRAENWAKAELNRSYPPRDRLWKDRDEEVLMTIRLPILKKNTLEESRALLGAEDDNFPIRDAEDLVNAAKCYLVEPYASRPQNLGKQRAAILEATIAIRNVIAHRSGRATEQMNKKLASEKLPPALRRGEHLVRAPKVGYHLQVRRDGRPRFEAYFVELAEVAHTLAPTKGAKKHICP